MPLLVAACPSFVERWVSYRAERYYRPENFHTHLAELARHLRLLLGVDAHPDLATTTAVLERLLTEGDSFVQDAVAGQLARMRSELSDPDTLRSYLGRDRHAHDRGQSSGG